MSDLRTAAQRMLAAVEDSGHKADVTAAADDLRAALAQQDEPVAWMEPPHGAIRANPNYKFTFPSQLLHWRIPLYTAPPQRKPLTEDEIDVATAKSEIPCLTTSTSTGQQRKAC